MASYVTPAKGEAFVFYVSLVSQANTKIMQANPTLEAGDVKIASDDGAPANLATLPEVDADFTKRVKVTVATTEMGGDNNTIIFSDAAGDEWCDLTVNIQTTTRQIDDLAVAGDAMTLANDAITSAKFDESTAFPVKAADSGSTYLARTGADSDTLETLSDQVDGVSAATIADAVWDEATAGHVAAGSFGAWVAAVTSSLAAIVAAIAALPAAVWAYVIRTLTTVAATSTSATGTTLDPIIAGVTYNTTISGLTIPADWLVMWLTIKDDEAKTDAQAIVQIVESNPGVGTDGMKFLNGAAGTAAHGALTVDQPGGSVATAIKAAATVQLDAAVLGYDLKVLSGTDTVTLLTSGVATVQRTETKSIA